MMAEKKPKKDETTEEKLESILHPSTKAKSFKITIAFGHNFSPDYKKAVQMVQKNPTYKKEGTGEWIRHSATYTPEQVDDLFHLYDLVHNWEKTEVLVNHKRIPYARQLWLPLMWFYRIK